MKTLHFLLVLLVGFSNSINAFEQKRKAKDTIVNYARMLHKKSANTELITYSDKVLKSIKIQTSEDSLMIAKLYYYTSKANYELGEYLASIKSSNNGIRYTTNSNEGIEYKGRLYADRAWPESKLFQSKKSIESLKKGIDFLANLSTISDAALDYTVNSYVLLSSELAYFGNLKEAQYYLRLAEKLYLKNKEALDKIKVDGNGNYHRYEIVLLYRKVYLLYKLGKTKKDSIELVNTIEKLEIEKNSKKFNVNERVYYSTALNHIGDWYLSHKEDSLITKEDVKAGTYYVDKSLDLILNQNYPGSYFVFKFNKCKALTKGEKLKEADDLITHLLDSLPKTSGIRPFFLAQKGLIKAKQNLKEEALNTFQRVIEKVHSGKDSLLPDYSNFKPTAVFTHSRLLRRVAEKIELYFGDDPNLKRKIARLYYLAFVQFENSYGKGKFNKEENTMLRKILLGFLKSNKKEIMTKNVTIENVLSRVESIVNKRSWQEFNQNRYTNSLTKLDSVTRRELDLKTALVIAKKGDKTQQLDSVQDLIKTHNDYVGKAFPNLQLLKDKKFNILELQKKLSKSELVLKYLILEKYLVIVSITNSSVKWQLKNWTQKERDILERVVTDNLNQNYNEEVVGLLSEHLLPDISSNKEKLIINPDGELYKLPFEILRKNNSYLIERYNISYTSNLGFIKTNSYSDKEKQEVYVYAPIYESEEKRLLATRAGFSALDGAKKEAEMVASLFSSKTYLGDEVTKDVFLESSPKASMLHLAMHAEMNAEEPGLSRLVFDEKGSFSNNVYLEELYALNLKADLAVLSACNTGLGKENAGRSLESFERAFTFAGVSSTVASLWEVPDVATSEIMKSFYQELKKGITKSEALQRAKESYILKNKETKLSNPYYWAGFVVYGDDAPVVESSSQWMIWLVLVLLLGSVFALKRNRN
ncbi:CHAT domain-containing protein [Tenacibaculum sp. 190524A05c]|uniref:CHAT domain-containing protein n=1 Tax=Tenacibaculum platacis TaxID=3137852 RepID=A0ABM9NSH3_9FLAO